MDKASTMHRREARLQARLRALGPYAPAKDMGLILSETGKTMSLRHCRSTFATLTSILRYPHLSEAGPRVPHGPPTLQERQELKTELPNARMTSQQLRDLHPHQLSRHGTTVDQDNEFLTGSAP